MRDASSSHPRAMGSLDPQEPVDASSRSKFGLGDLPEHNLWESNFVKHSDFEEVRAQERSKHLPRSQSLVPSPEV